MSCLKHHQEILSYCQSCTVFLCSQCPSHSYHITISYSLFINQCISEIESLSKGIQAKEKLLLMLQAKITGYFSALDRNKQSSIDDLKSAVISIHSSIDQRHKNLLNEIEQLVDSFSKPMLNYMERIKAYLQDTQSLIISSENMVKRLASKSVQDPFSISNDLKKLHTNESHYIDTFINSCRTSLENRVPVIPVAEKNLLAVESCLFLDYKSKHLEIKPLFPYWNLERLMSSISLKDQGCTLTFKGEGWSTALFKDNFSCGKTEIEFLILKDASGNKMYIGAIHSSTPGMNLEKALSSSTGYMLWSYRICGEMHSKNFVNSKHKDKRRFRRGDKVKMEIDMERMALTFYKNNEEIYTFVDISDSVIPFVCFGESFQSVKVISCESFNPKVIFH